MSLAFKMCFLLSFFRCVSYILFHLERLVFNVHIFGSVPLFCNQPQDDEEETQKTTGGNEEIRTHHGTAEHTHKKTHSRNQALGENNP